MKHSAIRLIALLLMVFLTILSLFVLAKLQPLMGMILLAICGSISFVFFVSEGYKWFGLYSILTCIFAYNNISVSTSIMLIPLIFIPSFFLFSATKKMGMEPLKAVGIALLFSTLFSSGIWFVINQYSSIENKVDFKKELAVQIEIFEKQLDSIPVQDADNAEAIEKIKISFREVTELIGLLVPITSLFIWHLLTLGLFYKTATFFSSIFKYKLDSLPEFKMWQFNWNLIWLYMIGLLFYFSLSKYNLGISATIIKTIGANCFMISSILFYIAGLSLLFFMFDKYKFGLFGRITLSFLALVFTQFIVLFGIINVWADFRKPKSVRLSSGSDDSDSGIFY